MRSIDEGDVSSLKAQAQAALDEAVISVIEQCICQGIDAKEELKKEVAIQTKLGRHTIGTLIDRYCGSDPLIHRWTFDVGGHGRRAYRLIGHVRDGPVIAPGTVF